MIGDVVIVLAIGLVAGSVGLWLGIVVLAPRLQRSLDRADSPEETAEEPDD